MAVRSIIAAFACLIACPAQAQDASSHIELMCFGGGAANKPDIRTGQAWNNNGGYASGQSFGTRSVGFDDQVNLWIEGNQGKIRMPRSMLPPIHGGEDGWFKLKSVTMTDREATGSVAVNALNNPKFRVDRYTGMISISGKAGDFTGKCQKYDPAIEKRAF